MPFCPFKINVLPSAENSATIPFGRTGVTFRLPLPTNVIDTFEYIFEELSASVMVNELPPAETSKEPFTPSA